MNKMYFNFYQNPQSTKHKTEYSTDIGSDLRQMSWNEESVGEGAGL